MNKRTLRCGRLANLHWPLLAKLVAARQICARQGHSQPTAVHKVTSSSAVL